jgi:hypothetical protein
MGYRSNHLTDANGGSRLDTRNRLERLHTTVDIVTIFLSIASVALLVDLFSQWIE